MTFRSLLLAATIVGLGAMPAAAQMHVVQNGGNIDTADPEPQLAGGPGMPTNIAGFSHPAQLVVDVSNYYNFTYLGSGNSDDTNRFTVGADFFRTIGPGGTTAGSTPVGTKFTQFLTAGTIIPFTFLNETTGCAIADGFNSTPLAEECHYLLAPGTVASATPTLGSVSAVYIGFSDRPDILNNNAGDHDYQDLGVLVEAVPEPASMALLGFGLAAVGVLRRRRG